MQEARTVEGGGKADALRQLHVEGPMLVLPNAWDAGSARIFVEAGFPALATTSAGIAFSLGYPDGERISRDEMLAAVARITRRISLPITADMEAGYGQTPDAVAETVRRVIDAGAVGMNLEDRIEETHLIEFSLAVERVRAARRAADSTGVRLVLNARTDAFEAPELPRDKRLAEAVRRGNAFREAGADSVFVPDTQGAGRARRASRDVRLGADARDTRLGAPDGARMEGEGHVRNTGGVRDSVRRTAKGFR